MGAHKHLLAAALLCSFAAHAAPVQFKEKSGHAVTVVMPARAADRVIIEFRERRPSAIASLQTRLASDLARIHGEQPGRVRVQSAGRIEHRYKTAFSGVSARVDRGAIPAIRALSYVKAVHPDRTVHAVLEHSVPQIGVPQVWEQYHTRGHGIAVAIVDSGIDYTHEAFGNRYAGGYDFVNGDGDPMDDNGHGTHVAGIVAGGVAPVIGVAPEATLVAYKVLDANGSGQDSSILAALEMVVDPNGDGNTSDHAGVVNMSLGRGPAADDPVVAAVERASAAGVVFCISAGNDGATFSIGSPGVAPSAITAGAVDSTDVLADFSSRGPVGGTWAIKPDVTAPGVEIVSAGRGGGTMMASGTSMSSPHVAGLAALVRELHPDWMPAEVKAAIVSSARPAESVIAAGAGRIDAPRAMAAVVLPSPVSIEFGIAAGDTNVWHGTRTLRLTNRGTSPQSLTITSSSASETTLAFTPSSLVLAPGASEEVRVDVTMNMEFAEPNDETFGMSGSIAISGPSTDLHVPWLVLMGNIVAARYQGEGDAIVALMQGGVVLADGNGSAASVSHGDTVDVFVLTSPLNEADDRQRVIVREQERVDGPTIIDISAEEAQYELAMASVDENGEPLSAVGSMSRGGRWWFSQILDVPSGVRLVFDLEKPVVMSPMVATTISAVEHEVHLTWVPTGGGQGMYRTGAHVAAHRSLTGLSQNETMMVGANEWVTGRIDHPCGEHCNYDLLLGLGDDILGGFPFGGNTVSRQSTLGFAGKNAQGDGPWAILTVTEQDRPPVPYRKPYSMMSPRFTERDGRIGVQLTVDPWPLDYMPPAGDPSIVFGYGPTLLRTTMGVRWNQGEWGRDGDEWSVKVTPTGMLGEELADDGLRLNIAMTDASGHRAEGDRIVSDNYGLTETLGEGPHRLEITERYRIGAAYGLGTLVSTIDKATRATAPTLTSMRIENSIGRATYLLHPNESARLVFSGRASTFFPYSNSVPGPIDTSATKVWWRPQTQSEWHELPLALLGTDETGADPIGSMFSADLTSVTAAAGGAVALRFELTNSDGATTSWTLEPAFFVETGRRHSVR